MVYESNILNEGSRSHLIFFCVQQKNRKNPLFQKREKGLLKRKTYPGSEKKKKRGRMSGLNTKYRIARLDMTLLFNNLKFYILTLLSINPTFNFNVFILFMVIYSNLGHQRH